MTAPINTPAPASDNAALSQRLDSMKELLAQVREEQKVARSEMPAPRIRTGEDPLSSRGYSFLKLFQVMSRKIGTEEAKVEIDLHNRLQKQLADTFGYQKAEANSIMAPFGAEFMPTGGGADNAFATEIRQLTRAGVAGADPREINEIRKRYGSTKALSWQDETNVGAIVPPPMMGELIDVLRNNEVLMAAGCRTIGMPPNGRMVWPRQTGAGTAYYVGESAAITESGPTTGDVILQAKKVATLVKVPNELFRYASISVESFLREDMMRVMALRMDKELLEGVGSSIAPKGLINYAGITTHTPIGTPADGNSGYPLQPEDLAQMVAKCEEKNAEFKAWVGRPLLWAYIVNKRADAVTANDGKGPFMFNVWRELANDMNLRRTTASVLEGYPFNKSTQLSNTRTRGSGTTNNTYLLGGDFSDYMLAISPTIEFAMTQQGDTAFANDQTWLRAILPHDGAPRREASFVFADNFLQS